MAHYTLKQCRYFLSVAEHGGIAQAARALNVSQPSVAQGVAKLEALTRLTLLERHHAVGTILTAQGRLFLPHATALVAHAEQVNREAQSIASEEVGEIRLGCFVTVAAAVLPSLIKAHQTQFPGVEVDARELTLTELAKGVQQSSLEIALTYDIGPHLDGLHLHKVAEVKPVVLLPNNHPKAKNASVSLRSLGRDSYVAFDAPGSREYFQGLLDDAGISPPVSYSSSSLEGVRNAVGSGLGFTIAQLRPARLETYDGQPLVAMSIKEKIKPTKLVMATREAPGIGSLTARFIAHALAYFHDQKLPGLTGVTQ